MIYSVTDLFDSQKPIEVLAKEFGGLSLIMETFSAGFIQLGTVVTAEFFALVQVRGTRPGMPAGQVCLPCSSTISFSFFVHLVAQQ